MNISRDEDTCNTLHKSKPASLALDSLLKPKKSEHREFLRIPRLDSSFALEGFDLTPKTTTSEGGDCSLLKGFPSISWCDDYLDGTPKRTAASMIDWQEGREQRKRRRVSPSPSAERSLSKMKRSLKIQENLATLAGTDSFFSSESSLKRLERQLKELKTMESDVSLEDCSALCIVA